MSLLITTEEGKTAFSEKYFQMKERVQQTHSKIEVIFLKPGERDSWKVSLFQMNMFLC